MDNSKLIKEIKSLTKEQNALLLAHNYQLYEIQEVADYVGDSLELSQLAAQTEKNTIVFCGVKFMAETAKVLAPEKLVLLPRLDAGCPMADMITEDDLLKLKKLYPNAAVVTYVNSSVEIKALSDSCCTSSNALSIVKNIESEEIIFIPDKNLGSYIQSLIPQKKIILFEAYCYVHNRIKESEILKIKEKFPQARVIVHPECTPEVIKIADEVLSTGHMIKYAKNSDCSQFIVGTEEGLLERLRRENPAKEFYAPYFPRICSNMKRTTLNDVYQSLKEQKYQIHLDNNIAKKARTALNKMIKYI